MGEKLRVGILCDGLELEQWQAECVRLVLAVDGMEPVVLVLYEKPARKASSFVQRVLHHPWHMALYLWWRKNRFKPAALSKVDVSDRLAQVPRVACKPVDQGTDLPFEPDDLKAIAHYRPDVLLSFGSNILKGEILTLPRYGVWSYHHGDEEKYRGQPPGFWEIMDGAPVTGAVLQRLTEKQDGGFILAKGWFRTIDHSLSASIDAVLMGSAGWAAQVCRALVEDKSDAANGRPSTTNAAIKKYPGNIDFINFLITLHGNKRRSFQRLSSQRLERNFGVLYLPISSLLDARPNLNVRWLPAPSEGQSRSAPFGYMADGQLNVLYEKFDHATGKGEISRLRPKRDNILKRSRTMLTSIGHYSHPFVLQKDDTVNVVPECGANDRVELYRVNEANDSLELQGTLLNERLSAPTLFEHNGLWWIMGTKPPLDDVALYAYYASSMEGPYSPHAMQPLKMDIRSARPAGTPFKHEGALYRPAADVSKTDGRRVSIMRVTELTPTTFREEWVKNIGPLKGSVWNAGLHTISAVGEQTLVECERSVQTISRTKRSSKAKKSGKREKLAKPDDDEEDDQE